jgi:transposase
LTTLPGVRTVRAAALAVHALPIERFPMAEHLYSFTGLAPARSQQPFDEERYARARHVRGR